MGGDGGDLPSRGDQVKEKSKEEAPNPQVQTRSRWTTCRLTSHPLGDDIVTCLFGMLYNREDALQYLADSRTGKRRKVPAFDHIKSMKDLLRLRPKMVSRAIAHDTFPRWLCPITGLEANGQHAFSAIQPCGCVISNRALQEVPSTKCISCGIEYSDSPIALLCSAKALASLHAGSLSSALITVGSAAPDAAKSLYKSPLEQMREERGKQKVERDKVEEEKKSIQEEELRLLATRKVGALLSSRAPVLTPASMATPSSLSGKRKDVFVMLAQIPSHSATCSRPQATEPAPKRATLAKTDRHAASGTASSHLNSLFSASLRPPV